MPTLMTVDITTNKKALDVKSNDLFNLGLVDFRENILIINNIRNIVLEDESNGFNINHVDGYKITLKIEMFSRIGTKDVAPFGNQDITTNQQLLDEFKLLAEL